MEMTETSYIENKIKSATSLSVFIDIAFIYLLYVVFCSGYMTSPPEEIDSYLINTALIQNSKIIKFFGVVYIIYCVANTLLLLSPIKATLGMWVAQIKLESSSGKKINIAQALGYFLLSPAFFSINFILLFHVYFNFEANLYHASNGIVLLFGAYTVINLIYLFRFNGWFNAQKNILGASFVFTAKKTEGLKNKWLKKEASSKSIFTLMSFIRKSTAIFLMTLAVYLSTLVILDLFKKPYMEQALYKPYPINWTRDNGYFALEGLVSPVDTKDFIEFGQSHTYKDALIIDDLKSKIKGFPRFEMPPQNSFVKVDNDFKPLEYQQIDNTHSYHFMDCYDGIKKEESDKICATDSDIIGTIAKNKILWNRFNQLPNFKEFQRPDIGIHGVVRGQTLISLARLKGADIIRLQKSGHSEEAFQEWIRFAKFYRRLIEAKITLVEKAIYMVVFAAHHKVLEKLLYNDPQLAKTHYDLIAETLNPQGIKIFRGQTMLADDFSNVEIYLLPHLYPSSGVRNKMFDCIKEQETLANLPSHKFPFDNPDQTICNTIQGGTWEQIFNMTLLTTGNPITSIIQGLVFGGVIKGVELISNMRIKDAELRMALLGAKIYRDKVTTKDIDAYIKNASIELQNPITQRPFEWNEKENRLFFVPPQKNAEPKSFLINFGMP